MIVKFFSKPSSGGGGGGSSIDYLLDEKKHQGKENIEVLQGDPELSRQITEGLDFATSYTVGCLSFEEQDIAEEDKRQIMERFEQSIFAGLDNDQYNILWVQHTDKDRLELNFFIPNVELTSGKRLQPYYDKADRPIVENFKQVINHEYSLTDPNAPDKQQTLITKDRLPKAKKEALEAINNGIEGLAKAGQIKSREDVVEALEGAGFEIARVTPKNISIKTEGQNLRLKGAFYEQSFQFGEGIREEITGRNEEYQRDSEQRYQTARKRLDSAVSKRKREFTKRYPSRANEINQEIAESVQHSEPNRVSPITRSSSRANVLGENGVQPNDRMEAVSGQLRENQPKPQGEPLPSERKPKPLLHSDRPELQGAILGGRGEHGNIADNSGGLTNDTKRETFRKRISRIVEQVRERVGAISERINEFTGRKRLDYADVQSDAGTKQANQRAINDLNRANQSLQNSITKKENRITASRGQGFSR